MSYEAEMVERLNLIRDVRDRMRDFAELNTLIDDQESTDRQISFAIDVVLEWSSASPPPIGPLSVATLPRRILLDGVTAELLESAALLLFRNDLPFSTGGVTVQFAQHQHYAALAQMYYQRYRGELREYKVSINHQQAVDGTSGIHTQWVLVNRPTRFLFDDVFSGNLLAGSPPPI